MDRIEVRPATAADQPALVPLFHEMERFYQGPAAIDPETVARRLTAGVFASGAPAEILIAERGGRLAGFACFSTIFPGKGLSLQFYLKDLFVGDGDRRSGVGAALIRALARLARTRGVGKILWSTGNDNAAAQRFYNGLGSKIRQSVGYILEEDEIQRLAEQADGR